jgi:hypothetical protein
MTDTPSTSYSIAKIDRANENIRNLQREFSDFIDGDAYGVIADIDPNPVTQTRRIVSVADVPLPLRVLVGEVVYHLRSAFDLLVYQLMLGVNATEAQLEKCAFPVIYCDMGTPEGLNKYESDLGRQIKAIRSTGAGKLIEHMQPCHHWNRDDLPLAQIDYLNRTDKHRLLLALVSSIPISAWTFSDGITRVPPDTYVPLQVGTHVKWESGNPDADQNRKWPTPIEITFGEPGPLSLKPVIPRLQQLSDFTRATIRMFDKFFSHAPQDEVRNDQ